MLPMINIVAADPAVDTVIGFTGGSTYNTARLFISLKPLNAVKMLFWSAVLNGALAPPLLILVMLLTSRADVMGEHRNGALLCWLGWTCSGVMLIETVIMLVIASAA